MGLIPNSDLVKDLDITDAQGWVKTDDFMQTRLSGIYAIGDIRAKHLRQVATAVGDGSIAGQHAYEYIQSINE